MTKNNYKDMSLRELLKAHERATEQYRIFGDNISRQELLKLSNELKERGEENDKQLTGTFD